MTLDQFINEMKGSTGWYLEDVLYGDNLRRQGRDRDYCPLTFVAKQSAEQDLYPEDYVKAGITLGFSEKDIDLICLAADDDCSPDSQAVRHRMLVAVGLADEDED